MTSLPPLVLPRREWERLRGPRDAGGGDARRARRVRRLDQASREMAKDWPNSVENVNRRKEELRAQLKLEAERANEDFYAEYLLRQRREQSRMMERARDRVFQDRDAPKTLLRAVIECATLKERSLQLDFQRQLKKEQLELDRKNDEHVIDLAQRWLEDKKKKARTRFLINKQHRDEISTQIKECSERIRLEKEEELLLEQKDNEKARLQVADIKNFEENAKLAERARIKADMDQASAEVARRLREESEREVLDEKLRQVYLRYKHEVDCHRKRTEGEILKEKRRMQEKMGTKLETGSAVRDAREQEMLERAALEKQEREDARYLADRKKTEELIQDRHEEQRKFLEREERRRHEEATMKTWSMLNRSRNTELTEQFEKKQRARDWQRTLQHRHDLLKLRKEREDRDAQELAERRYFYGELAERRMREADDKVLRHAALLREEACAAGHPTYPLDRELEAFRRKYHLYPEVPLPASQQEHFRGYSPEDRTRPAENTGPEERNGPEEPQPRDGLQK